MAPRKQEGSVTEPSVQPVASDITTGHLAASEVSDTTQPPVRPVVASEASFESAARQTAATLAAQEKVRIRLYQVPKDSTDRPMPDEFVSINGHNYSIKRGETVEVPQSVYEVLEHAGRL